MEHYGEHSKDHQSKRRKREAQYSPAIAAEPRAASLSVNSSSRNPESTNIPLPTSRAREDEGFDDSYSATSPSSQPHLGRRLKQPPVMIDWRGQICQFLGMVPESSDGSLLEALQFAADKVAEAERLASVAAKAVDIPPRFQIIHRVRCATEPSAGLYLEEPFVVNSGPRNFHLRGSLLIDNFDLYLERNKEISFLAYKDYRCCGPSCPEGYHSNQPPIIDSSTFMTSESVAVISGDFCSALTTLAQESLQGIPHPKFEVNQELKSPYLWWYHGRQRIADTEELLEYYQKEHIALFQEYLSDSLGEKWAEVDSLLSSGRISARFIEYLYVPNTVIVSRSNHEKFGQQQAYLTSSWLQVPDVTQSNNRSESHNLVGFVDGICWVFAGNFTKKASRLPIDRLPSMKKPFKIRDLALYPINFAEEGLEEVLQMRGEMFWKCRRRNYVCYSGELNDGIQSTSDPRFMIDIATYKQMHAADRQMNVPTKDDLGAEIMASDDPPEMDNFLLCLPTTIPGFNMNKKEWTSLDVSQITPVKWNDTAFDSLVVDKETKELISALVTNQIDTEKSTDLMSGKGNGLFILLHGGPGTGKTLTAESVAEYAQKPLYRVTCGDIGTKAEEVEKYLDVVMLLGKTWAAAIVLLDEADVFLEQRKISDLQRNALVSVFLRVLEYYDGILILTSNRVGIFDEAFKSRIQLTLRYKNLEKEQRRQIWQNFITRLESFQNSTPDANSGPQRPHHVTPANPVLSGVSRRATIPITPAMGIHSGVDLGINSKEVRAKIDELAEAKLNGREIRNAVSTARQLAMFRGQPMGYEHIHLVIEEAKKFNTYLEDLNQGFSSDQIMKDSGER